MVKRYDLPRIRVNDMPALTEDAYGDYVLSTDYETLKQRAAALESENAKLKVLTKDAYFEGWHGGRNTCSVSGDPTPDWNDSDTAQGKS